MVFKRISILFILLLFSCTKKSDKNHFFSEFMERSVFVADNVFTPEESEIHVLPYMNEHKDLFDKKTILDIGTGSGIIGLYAAKLGAKKVVATDISPQALSCAEINRNDSSYQNVFETRLVPLNDMSAYSVIKADEQFDTIISNPPYSLDVDSSENTALVDKGDLGLSIIDGLSKHLKKDGQAVLLYRSIFYQQVIVKYARAKGFQVEYEPADLLLKWELKAMFNNYITYSSNKIEGLKTTKMKFDWDEKELADLIIEVKNSKKRVRFPGIIVIRN